MSNRLKRLRKKLGLTQQEFADKINISRNSIASYETGKSNIGNSVISLICREFNVNEDWLRNGGSDDDMFIKLNEDEELARYTQMLLDSTDDVIADTIKEIIIMYEKLDNESKQILKNSAKSLLDKMKNT